MNSLFTHVPVKRPKRNFFDLGHEKKLSFAPGKIVPILCQETVPGDKFRCNAEIALQFAPMLAPLMHRVDVVTRFFFVPNRLIWPDFNKQFISGGPEGTSSIQVPSFNPNHMTQADPGGGSFPVSNSMGVGSLADYLGINPKIMLYQGTDDNKRKVRVSSLPFRAYQLIYNEYFRNQNSEDDIIDEFDMRRGSYEDSDGPYALWKILQLRTMNWQHDYFTSTLPWTQRGNPVTVPITGTGQLEVPSQAVNISDDGSFKLETLDGGDLTNAWSDLVLGEDASGSSSGTVFAGASILPPSNPQSLAYEAGLKASTSPVDVQVALEGAGITIESLRRTARLQEWLEKNARAGARYIEQIISHFGVRSSDARLQRPEYLGGGRQIVKISNVLQTSGTTDVSPQANPSGYGTAYGMSNRFKYFCEEHGYIIGVMYVMPKSAYEQGLPRMFSHIDRFDYYFPEFAHLGEQDVKLKELWHLQDATNDPDQIFGYLPRYAEYKSALSSIHGDMRTTLDFWHWGRKFAAAPAWNDTFMKYQDDRRIFANEDNTDPIWSNIYIDLKAKRPMPKFGVPYL